MIDTRWQRPGFDVVRIAHLELVVTDLARAREFYCDVLGLVLTEETGDALYVRGLEERLHHSLALRLGPVPCLGHLGFRMASAGDVERVAKHFESLGCDVRRVEEGEEAGQGVAARTWDPLGFPVEFFFDMQPAERLLQRCDLYRGAEPMRLDHANLFVPDVVEAYEHYRRLGFRCSEYIATDLDDRLVAAWMFRKPSVHDVAFTTGVGPRLHHFALTAQDPATILRFCDRLAGARRDTSIERGPGRHGVSNAFFVYLRDPDGHRIELFTGDYYTGDPDFEPIRWSVSDPRRRTFWGHAVPDSWYDEGTVCAAGDGRQVALSSAVLDERLVEAE